ncbi:MAG: response regulator [Helicobacteraceae bacterium]|nr:response regulator [Helicobacteraceae bacterium]
MLTNANLSKVVETTQHLKLLYVEDNKEARESTLLMLQNFFENIVTASNGAEALTLYKNHFTQTNNYFDLVLSDIQMPQLDGIGLSKAIYEINKNQKIVIVSAYSDKEYLIELINMGVDGFMQKPISLVQLSDVIKNISHYFENYGTQLNDGFVYNLSSGILFKNSKKVELHSSEIKLLELLFSDTNKSFSMIDIFNHIFYDKPEKEFSSDAIRALIKRVRAKLPKNLILNSRTLGYSINID